MALNTEDLAQELNHRYSSAPDFDTDQANADELNSYESPIKVNDGRNIAF